MARVPGGVELPRRGGRFENRQKTCCSQPPGCTSPCFACLIQTGLIKVAACRCLTVGGCGCVRIVASGECVQVIKDERFQIASGEFIPVATCEFNRTARRQFVQNAQRQDGRPANGDGAPRRPVRPRRP